MAIEFGERIRRIPSYPLAAGYDLGAGTAMLASNESCFAPAPGVVEAAARALGGVHRYPDPAYAPLRQALSDRYGVPRERMASSTAPSLSIRTASRWAERCIIWVSSLCA